jgi:hypothetical protein
MTTFSWEGSACAGKTDIFFPLQNTSKTTNRAREFCRNCPLYERCVEYWLPRYDEAPMGIFFGYTDVERRQMDAGTLSYRDWRNDAKLVSKKTLAALERHAANRGVKAVVDIYLIYEVDDMAERQRIIAAYEQWLTDMHIAGAHEAARMRTEYWTERGRLRRQREREAKRPMVLKALKEGVAGVRVPADLRPECPNGHGQKDMVRSRRKGRTIWWCYICKAKVEADPQELAEEALRSA